MLKFRYPVLLLALTLLFVSGCSLSSYQKAEMDKTLENFHVTRFEFGVRGNIDVTTSKELVIDGRNWNFSELLASVFQDAMRDRGISVGKLMPTKGGAYLLDELRVVGRDVIVSAIWYPSGNIRIGAIAPITAKSIGKLEYISPQAFTATQKHYESDEELYEGLKAELRPHVEILLDAAFGRVNQLGATDY